MALSMFLCTESQEQTLASPSYSIDKTSWSLLRLGLNVMLTLTTLVHCIDLHKFDLHDGQEIFCPQLSLTTSSQLLKEKVQNVGSKFSPSSSQLALIFLKEKPKWFTMCEL